jgi:hypothetical protein
MNNSDRLLEHQFGPHDSGQGHYFVFADLFRPRLSANPGIDPYPDRDALTL